MRLLKGGRSLDSKLKKLIEEHEFVSFAVAWATPGSEAYSSIIDNRKKIKKAVIGTHFYQTHPDVLDDFVDFKACRFVLQPQGVFHPKIFVFWSKKSWDLLIGSANLTKGALTKNTELLMHVSSSDEDGKLLDKSRKLIAEFWAEGGVITATDAEAYRALWQNQQDALRRVSGDYGGSGKKKPPARTEIMTMPWPVFLERVKSDPYHGFKERCDLLELVRESFSTHDSFSDMELGVRKTIAGLPNDYNENWGWFGGMSGTGYYHQAVNDNNAHISNAVDLIPLDGEVTRACYDSYIDELLEAFPNGGVGVGVASRLLALKRPDQFVCLDSRNKVKLCKDFSIKQSGMDYQRYWDEVVCRIMDSVWWNAPEPKRGKSAKQVWQGRAAMLDALFFAP